MKKKLSLKGMLTLFALVPLTVGIIVLATNSAIVMSSNLKRSTFEQLKLAAQSLRSYYEYDLLNDNALVDGFLEYNPEEYIDVIYNTSGVNLTLFKDNVRFMTSLRNDDGSRNEGTTASDAVWAAVKNGNDYESDDVVINKVDYYVYYMTMYDSEHNFVGMAFAGKPTTQVNTAIGTIIRNTIIIAIILEIVFVLLAIIISKKVSAPIKEVATKLAELSEGSTDISIVSTTNIDETAILINSTNTLRDTLKDIITKILSSVNELDTQIGSTSNNANEVSDEMSQISTSMQELADSTQTLAGSVQDINTTVSDMGEVVNTAVERVNSLKASTKSMTEANSNAVKCINDVSDSSTKSVQAINNISQSIAATNDAVEKINQMVSLISDIASQTNLLSLNASIEAARAGEAGRGFAVVASEIGNLAQSSNASTSQIKDIVSEITQLSETCVEQAGVVNGIIQEEQTLLGDAMTQFDTLNEEINSSVGNIEAVSDIVDNISGMKDSIISSMTDLSAVSEETSATNEEVTATVESVSTVVVDVSDNMGVMSKLSNSLRELVQFFKV